jgi:hypothetical protein
MVGREGLKMNAERITELNKLVDAIDSEVEKHKMEIKKLYKLKDVYVEELEYIETEIEE